MESQNSRQQGGWEVPNLLGDEEWCMVFGLCHSPMQNDPSHKSPVRYNLTGKAVGMSSLTCQALKLSEQEISRKSEEVQVYFQFEGDSLQDYGRIVFCVFNGLFLWMG